MSTSRRSKKILEREEFLDSYFQRCVRDLYDQETNPQGYANLGTAESFLCDDLIKDRLNRQDVFKASERDIHYFPMWGFLEVRSKFANFFSHYFKAARKVDPDNVILVNGGAAGMEVLGYGLFDPGDVLLTPSPAYKRVFANFNDRFEIDVVAIPMTEQPIVDGSTFQLTPEIVEATILREQSKGKTVKGLAIVNPNNPLGDVYSPKLLGDLLLLCAKYDLHYISDELYALSVYDEKSDFHSILRLEHLPAPEKTHLLWSFSKDMCLSGLRVGALVTWNESFLKVCRSTPMYFGVPAAVHTMAANLLEDREWLDGVFLPANKERLRKAESTARTSLESLGVRVRPSKAGFFLWADFRRFMQSSTKDEEHELFRRLMEKKVYITPGTELASEDPGFFRIIFTVKPNVLEEGLQRIREVLNGIQST